MRCFLFFVTSCLVILTACNHAANTTGNASNDTTSIDTMRSTAEPQFDVVIFGKYCGHCLDNCTNMFRYANGNPITLLADTTDNFFRKGTFQFDWFLLQEQHAIANALVEAMPAQLKTVSDTVTRFGCPDCADQCGFYLETIDASQRSRKFQFDTDTAQVPQELRSFVIQLGNAVTHLKQ